MREEMRDVSMMSVTVPNFHRFRSEARSRIGNEIGFKEA